MNTRVQIIDGAHAGKLGTIKSDKHPPYPGYVWVEFESMNTCWWPLDRLEKVTAKTPRRMPHVEMPLSQTIEPLHAEPVSLWDC